MSTFIETYLSKFTPQHISQISCPLQQEKTYSFYTFIKLSGNLLSSQSAAKAAVYADKYCFSPLPVVIENAEPGFEPAVEQIRSLSLKLV